ncbi:unnamed protein product [Thlaspi arvense]|uniref:Uncharacterized protein n=1 Tax=Thlaspi arvense TaxID=13288 RepID=A0AAU9T8W2_THLAR|nr:unnamed protein product [Thlaspi arvense]
MNFKGSDSVAHKRKAGRKKFKETRHPIYSGVRMKRKDKWVSEVRDPNNKKSRICEAQFPDSAHALPRAKSSSARDIQLAAVQAARVFHPASPSSSSSTKSPSSHPKWKGSLSEGEVSELEGSDQKVVYIDEEELFNMPGLLDSMAEGLLLSPPGLEEITSATWDEMATYDMDMALWTL